MGIFSTQSCPASISTPSTAAHQPPCMEGGSVHALLTHAHLSSCTLARAPPIDGQKALQVLPGTASLPRASLDRMPCHLMHTSEQLHPCRGAVGGRAGGPASAAQAARCPSGLCQAAAQPPAQHVWPGGARRRQLPGGSRPVLLRGRVRPRLLVGRQRARGAHHRCSRSGWGLCMDCLCHGC